MRHGFDLGYNTWVHHDESDLPSPPPLIYNTRQAQMSDMTTLLNDLSYIPPNNEHNEISNELTQATRNEFKELYTSANEELYLGCDYVTRLDFMAKFTYFKVKGKLTDFIFNEMLEFLQNVFPINNGYKLPPSYYAIKKTFKMIRSGYKSIHACEHDCCLFRGDDNKDLYFYMVCNTSRWKDSNTPGKKVPKKVLRYFLIIPRLQRLYKSSHTSGLQHVAGDIDNIQFASVVMYESSFMLTLLIPGPKSLGKDIDVYLIPLIEDLKRQSSATQEYPSLINTFFVAHTVNGVFTQDEDSLIYEEMRRLKAMGTYTDDEINRLARRGKQRGHIHGVGRVLPIRVTSGSSRPAPESTLTSLHKKVDFMMSLFKSDSKLSDALSQLESAGASESGGCGDDEESADDQEDEDGDSDTKVPLVGTSGDCGDGADGVWLAVGETVRTAVVAILAVHEMENASNQDDGKAVDDVVCNHEKAVDNLVSNLL
nr:hypothetical protein [Tanacetum cinerariifolium]